MATQHYTIPFAHNNYKSKMTSHQYERLNHTFQACSLGALPLSFTHGMLVNMAARYLFSLLPEVNLNNVNITARSQRKEYKLCTQGYTSTMMCEVKAKMSMQDAIVKCETCFATLSLAEHQLQLYKANAAVQMGRYYDSVPFQFKH